MYLCPFFFLRIFFGFYAFFGAFRGNVINAPTKHATPAIVRGVIHAAGSVLPLAASLKKPAICGLRASMHDRAIQEMTVNPAIYENRNVSRAI